MTMIRRPAVSEHSEDFTPPLCSICKCSFGGQRKTRFSSTGHYITYIVTASHYTDCKDFYK